MSDQYQSFYDWIMESLLRLPILNRMVLFYFWILCIFRLGCMILVEKYTIPNLHLSAFIISVALGRAHHTGIIIIFILIFANFEFSFLRMARFYKKHPMLLGLHFPEWQDPKRKMHRVVQAIVEVAQNPTVVAAGTLVAGAIGWKALDVWDSHKQEGISEKDRIATAVQSDKDRTAENQRHRENLATESRERQKDRDTEAQERQKDRDASREELRMTLEADDRRHRETLEAENQRHRETLLAEKPVTDNVTVVAEKSSNNDPSVSNIESTNDSVDESIMVD